MRVSIIGCGHVLERHIRPLHRITGIEIVGVCDANKAKAEETAGRFGIDHAYTDPARMLLEQIPDVVHILTPPQTHRDLSVQAMEAGCHVLVEKPISLNLSEAEEMTQVSKRTGVILSVCHNFLFEPTVLVAKKLVARGDLGRVLSTEIFWRIYREGKSDRYLTTRWIHDLPGGVFHEVAYHPVYLQMEFLEGLRVVSAASKRTETGVIPTYEELRVLLDAETGLASFSVSMNANPRQVFMRIYGTKMTLHLDLTTNSLIKLRAKAGEKISRFLINLDQSLQLFSKSSGSAILTFFGRPSDGHETLIKRFYESIRQGKGPPVTSEKGEAVMAILDRIWTELNWISS